MKKWMLLLFALSLAIGGYGQAAAQAGERDGRILAEPTIDPRVELVSIVFRLAGVPEYNQDNFKIYTDAIRAHFDKYKGHPCVAFAKKMWEENGVGFNAPMDLAIHVSPAPAFTPLVEFDDKIPEYRWGKKNAGDFLGLLRSFYADAHCEEFFAQNAPLYKTVLERFRVVYDAVDTRWYREFYGTAPTGKFVIIVGIGNGGCNYGSKIVHPDGREDVYATMGTWTVDEGGLPVYTHGYYLSTLIHEFNHSFINRLNEKHYGELKASGSAVFEPVGSLMSEQAYPTPLHALNEALVRAAVVRYIARHNADPGKAESEMRAQLSNGFIWIDGLVAKLEYYEQHRDRYPTLESFMPEIAGFYGVTARNLEPLLARCARVKATVGIENHSAGVSPKISEMKVVFDKPVQCDDGLAIFTHPEQKKEFPVKKEGTAFSPDRTSLVLALGLKPDTSYYFRLPGLRYHTAEGYPLLDYVFEFATGKGA
ncbi:MAG TPA: DUF4932 domain-containing protein [Candidatus Aminicenantes bacterium]|nr:DUF4932 domain-containing protein [Candidatus Aminicenantes bacterium]